MIDIKFIQHFAEKEDRLKMGQSALKDTHRKTFKLDFQQMKALSRDAFLKSVHAHPTKTWTREEIDLFFNDEKRKEVALQHLKGFFEIEGKEFPSDTKAQ